MDDTMKRAYNPRQAVRCNHCGCAFVPEMRTVQDGEIEYSYFNCDYCGKAYVVSVTDAALRRDIARYAAVSRRNRIKRLSEKKLRAAAQLKEANVRRSAELRKQYLGG